jgi:hypothetical protein
MKRQGSPAGYCTSHQEFLAISGERKQEEDDGDASDWSLHDKSSADDMSDSSVNGSKSLVPIGSQFQYFKSETERCHFKVYRTILSGAVDKDPIAALRGLQLSNSAIADDLKPYWTIVMLSGGHFAGAVFDNRSDDGKMVDHCTIHRYVTRRKQVRIYIYMCVCD